jgi:hypothetical protein
VLAADLVQVLHTGAKCRVLAELAVEEVNDELLPVDFDPNDVSTNIDWYAPSFHPTVGRARG